MKLDMGMVRFHCERSGPSEPLPDYAQDISNDQDREPKLQTGGGETCTKVGLMLTRNLRFHTSTIN